ncbi:MAG: DUF6359 domain-containing protein [Bacteroidales bacterium]|jgi:hypothetical protein
MCRKIFKTAVFFLLAAVWACNGLVIVNDPHGQLFVKVTKRTPYGVNTRSMDVDSFVFILTTSEGDTLCNSTVGEITGEPLSLKQGTYYITVFNELFTVPAFEKPFYYKQTEVDVVAGSICEAFIVCTQNNAGVRVLFTESFMNSNPGSFMTVIAPDGELSYDTTTEHKWGYYNPGPVTLMLYRNNIPSRSYERSVDANYMYTFLVGTPDTLTQYVEPSFSISVDTARVWNYGIWDDEDYGKNGVANGLAQETAFSISQARTLPDNTANIWVYGYIAGYYKSQKFIPGSEIEDWDSVQASCLALAEDPKETEKANTFSIELLEGSLRNAINLKDHPDHLYKKIWIKGTTSVSYQGVYGLKNPKDYSW